MSVPRFEQPPICIPDATFVKDIGGKGGKEPRYGVVGGIGPNIDEVHRQTDRHGVTHSPRLNDGLVGKGGQSGWRTEGTQRTGKK